MLMIATLLMIDRGSEHAKGDRGDRRSEIGEIDDHIQGRGGPMLITPLSFLAKKNEAKTEEGTPPSKKKKGEA